MTLTEQKKQLRRACLDLRLAIPEAERASANAALCRKIAASDAFCGADLLLLYLPMRGEPDLTPLRTLAAARGIPVALPRCHDGVMTFHLVSEDAALVPDAFGIPAPPPDAPQASTTEKSLCLLPGLAAGRDGSRLGYGGGFYDTFLATFRGITLFPIYECLLFDTLPQEATDRTVDAIVTEKGEG